MKPLLTMTSTLNGFSYGFVFYILLLVNHQNLTISREFSFFPPSSVLVADKTGWLSLRVYTGQNTTTWISACKLHSASNQRTKQTCMFDYKRDQFIETPPRIRSVTKLSKNISLKSTLCNLNTLRPIPDFIRLLNQNCQRSRTNSIERIFL